MSMPVADIQKGDEFRYDDGRVLWKALARPSRDPDRPGFTRVHVEDVHLGDCFRTWPEGTTLPIDRPEE